MTIKEALALGRQWLVASASPALDSRLLLEHVLNVGHAFLVAHADEALTAAQEQTYRALLERAADQEPIPYLTGRAPFFGLEFAVSPAVLIPRPETEHLIEAVLNWAKGREGLRAVDVGTGSGCIAVTLAKHLPSARVEATEVSAVALEVALLNARHHSVADRITFYQGELLDPLAGMLDLIVANLPYVSGAEWTALPHAVKWYEPEIALQGGPDGLDLIRRLLDQARSRLSSSGAMFLEVGWQQGAAARRLANLAFPRARVDILQDYSGLDRVVCLKLNT